MLLSGKDMPSVMPMAPFSNSAQSATCPTYAPSPTQTALAGPPFSSFRPSEGSGTWARQGGSQSPAPPMASGVNGQAQFELACLQRLLNSAANKPPRHISAASRAPAVPPCDSAVVPPDFMSFSGRASPPGPELLSERGRSNTGRMFSQDVLAPPLQTDGFELDDDTKQSGVAQAAQGCECSKQLPDLIALLKMLRIETAKGFGGIFSSGHALCASCSEFIQNYLKEQEAMRSLERPMRNHSSATSNKNKIGNNSVECHRHSVHFGGVTVFPSDGETSWKRNGARAYHM